MTVKRLDHIDHDPVRRAEGGPIASRIPHALHVKLDSRNHILLEHDRA
jgi:hypothetical protein